MDASIRAVSIWQRLLKRVGNPLEWSYVDKCLLVIGMSLPFSFGIVLQVTQFDMQAREFPNYKPWITAGLRDVELAITLFWLFWGFVGLALRKRSPNNGAYVFVTTAFFALGNLPAAYFFGPFVSPIWLIAVGSGVIGLLLFPPMIVVTMVGLLVLGLIGIALSLWQGWLPYASLMESPPTDFVGSSGAMLWIYMMTSNSLAVVAFVIAAFAYTVTRWRKREAELAIANKELATSQERLTRATDLIRRYVATQVADQILAGDQDPLGIRERRKLTIFFSDIKGFTEASDQMDSEDLSRILNEYLSEMSSIAAEHGGTIDKFVGDAIMIFFGAPAYMPDRDQAVNAVRMASAMVKRMEFLREKWFNEGMQFPFETRIGINTGIANVGNFGSRERLDYTAIGKQVNLAARLESACEPGRILISHPTWALIKEEIGTTPKGEISVKGIHHPIKVYDVTLL